MKAFKQPGHIVPACDPAVKKLIAKRKPRMIAASRRSRTDAQLALDERVWERGDLGEVELRAVIELLVYQLDARERSDLLVERAKGNKEEIESALASTSGEVLPREPIRAFSDSDSDSSGGGAADEA